MRYMERTFGLVVAVAVVVHTITILLPINFGASSLLLSPIESVSNFLKKTNILGEYSVLECFCG